MRAQRRMNREDVLAEVHGAISAILPTVPRSEMRGDRHLKHLGADSVERVEIIMMLIDRMGLDEPMSSFSAIPDIDGLVDFLWARCGR